MTTGSLLIVGLLAAFAAEAPSPPSWSSDGAWLAYRSRDDAPGAVPEAGWITRASIRDRVRPIGLSVPDRPTPVERVHVASPAGGHFLGFEGAGRLTPPVWDATGHGLLFGAFSGAGGRASLEILRRGFEPEPTRLTTLDGGPPSPTAEGAALAASPDGRYLAVARPWVPDVLILRADNGRKLKELPDATRPAWSRDGSRLAYITAGDAPWLHVLDANFGPAKVLVGPVEPVPPVWSRDGAGVFVVLRRALPAPAVRGEALELVNVSWESRAAETVTRLGLTGVDPTAPPASVSFTLTADGEDLFYAISAPAGVPTSIVWYRPRTGETVSKFHPLDSTVGVTSLSVSPDGKFLAGRYGPDGLVGLSEPGKGDLTPLAPDPSDRLNWVRLLVETGRRLVHLALPPAAASGKAVDRATLIPAPGEVAKNAEIGYRLRRIARAGLPLCRPGRDAAPVSPEARRFLDEAALFFEALNEDWGAARRSLERVQERTTDPDDRLRLLSLSAQVWMGQGELDRAGEVVAYLAEVDARSPKRLERTPSGYVLTDEPGALGGWPTYLKTRLESLAGAANAPGRPPLGHRNPDNPNDGQPLDFPMNEIRSRLPFRP